MGRDEPADPLSPSGIHVAVLEASPNAIVAVDDRGRIAYVNPQVESTFGYARNELIGEPIERLLPERVADKHVGQRDGFLAHPVARAMSLGLDLAGRRRDGSEFPADISLSPFGPEGARLVMATVVDITARKAAEHQLLQARKLESIGRLAGGIAHDFNNMLFAIRGYSELLAEDLASDDPSAFDATTALGWVGSIMDAADRATSLTSQLLAFSRQRVVSPKVIDVSTAVLGVEPMLRPLIGEDTRLLLKLDPDAGRITIDPSQLDQILVNLALNARDAMTDGGTITIETGSTVLKGASALEPFDVTPGPYVCLAVSDTGVGMDRPTREHIFEPFFTTKEPGKGTGLGLATVYGIVRQAAGQIWLDSEVGRGTRFKVYFPRVESPVGDRLAPSTPMRQVSGRVLVVEDDLVVREMTSRLLERAGYRVTAEPDGSSAIARWAASTRTRSSPS